MIKDKVTGIQNANLWQKAENHMDVVAAYNGNEVDRASYDDPDGHILKYWFMRPDGSQAVLDIGNISNRKSLLYGILKKIFKTETWFREIFERDYGFEFIGRFIEDMDFDTAISQKKLKEKDVDEYRARYEEEFSILVRSFEQAMSLIYFNPILREMLKTANYERVTADTIDIYTKKLDSYIDRIQRDGLPIVREEHENGFKGSVDNHGSIFLDNNGKMKLHLDINGQLSIAELCHEYAAYLFIKKALENETPHFSNEDSLQETKNKKLGYVLLFIDLLSGGKSKVMQEALNI